MEELKRGLYVMIFANREDSYDDDFSDDSKWLGAVYVGEISSGFRQSFLKAILKRLDKRYNKGCRSFGIDFYYHDNSGDGPQNESASGNADLAYPRKPTETELMGMLISKLVMSPDQREILDFAKDVANEIEQATAEPDGQIVEKTVNSIVVAIEKQTEILEKVYFDKQPKPLTQKDYPKDNTGFWESQEEYAKRIGLAEGTLKRYREKKNGVRRYEDGTWGIDKAGNIFKKVSDKSNSPYQYFVRDDP